MLVWWSAAFFPSQNQKHNKWFFSYLLSLFFPPDWVANIARCACLDVLCRWNSIKRANYSSLLIFAGLCNDDSPSYPQQPFLFAADAHVLCKFRLCGHKKLSQIHLFHSAASSTREIVYSSVNLMPACAQRTKLSSWNTEMLWLRPFRSDSLCTADYDVTTSLN